MSTANDAKVLNAILNPNTPFEEDLQPQETASKYETTEEIEAAKQLEVKGIKAAEANDLNTALEFFKQAITVAPTWASAYNNRAQALRLIGDIDGALSDLETGISLADTYEDTKVLALALAQKGTILRLKNKDTEALECFKRSAELGNRFAKQQVVALNPYAAMCNKMLANLFEKVKQGQA